MSVQCAPCLLNSMQLKRFASTLPLQRPHSVTEHLCDSFNLATAQLCGPAEG